MHSALSLRSSMCIIYLCRCQKVNYLMEIHYFWSNSFTIDSKILYKPMYRVYCRRKLDKNKYNAIFSITGLSENLIVVKLGFRWNALTVLWWIKITNSNMRKYRIIWTNILCIYDTICEPIWINWRDNNYVLMHNSKLIHWREVSLLQLICLSICSPNNTKGLEVILFKSLELFS